MKSIKCPSCNLNQNDSKNVPMLIKCGHSVCSLCLNQKLKLLKSSKIIKHNPQKCTVCKHEIPNIQDSIPNSTLLDLQSELSNYEIKARQDQFFQCYKHKERPVDQYCYDTNVFVCHECAFDDKIFQNSRKVEKFNTQNMLTHLSQMKEFFTGLIESFDIACKKIDEVFNGNVFNSNELKFLLDHIRNIKETTVVKLNEFSILGYENGIMNEDKDDQVSNDYMKLERKIQKNFPMEDLTDYGFSIIQNELQSHNTSMELLLDIKRKQKNHDILVGSYVKNNAKNIKLCAIGSVGDVLNLSQEKQMGRKVGDVQWQFVNDESAHCFGFSDSEYINLSPWDNLEGEMRLSWDISGSNGGYRSGNKFDLQSEQYKVIMVNNWDNNSI